MNFELEIVFDCRCFSSCFCFSADFCPAVLAEQRDDFGYFSSNVRRIVFTFFLLGCCTSNLGGPRLVGQAVLLSESQSELHEPEKVNRECK